MTGYGPIDINVIVLIFHLHLLTFKDEVELAPSIFDTVRVCRIFGNEQHRCKCCRSSGGGENIILDFKKIFGFYSADDIFQAITTVKCIRANVYKT